MERFHKLYNLYTVIHGIIDLFQNGSQKLKLPKKIILASKLASVLYLVIQQSYILLGVVRGRKDFICYSKIRLKWRNPTVGRV